MKVYFAELIGTAMLVLLGNGAVANVVLKQTKGNQAGWLAIAAGWGMAVYVAVACTQQFSGAHINPAVTVGLAAAGKFAWSHVPGYLAAQFLGALLGGWLVYVVYRGHFHVTEDADAKLGSFCTAPALRNLPTNLLSEVLATFVLVFTVLMFAQPELQLHPDTNAVPFGLGALGAMPVALLVFSIGLSLGGTTGYAINPARDLSPRLVHTLLAIPGKRDSDWGYAWVPAVGPVLGGLLAAALFHVVRWT